MAEATPLHERTRQAGAEFVERAGWLVPATFGAEAEEEQPRAGAVVFDQCPRGTVEVAGPDAPMFLHNLCSNDVRALPAGAGCETFLLTAKARVVAHGFAYRLDEKEPTFWLDLVPGVHEAVYAHLDHHLISERLELLDRTRELGQVHLAGPEALALAGRVLGEGLADLADLHVRKVPLDGEEYLARRNDRLGVVGLDMVGAAGRIGEVWDRLTAAGARPAGLAVYERLRVEAGRPEQGPDIDETTFAPDVGRTAQAISYAKGCYLGQEPVVMARDRGQVNRTLLGVKLPAVVPPGSLLYREGKEVGRVTSSVHSMRLDGAIGLAYVRRGHQEPGTAVEVEVGGERRPAEVSALPFVG
jgi:folate-binding protein YgfZ